MACDSRASTISWNGASSPTDTAPIVITSQTFHLLMAHPLVVVQADRRDVVAVPGRADRPARSRPTAPSGVDLCLCLVAPHARGMDANAINAPGGSHGDRWGGTTPIRARAAGCPRPGC